MQKRRIAPLLIGAVLVAAGAPMSVAAAAEDVTATIKELQRRIREQDRRIADQGKQIANQEKRITDFLRGKDPNALYKARYRQEILEVMKDMHVDASKRSNDFRVYWKEGLRFDSADSNFKLRFGGRLFVDSGWIDGTGIEKDIGSDLQDGIDVRTARLYTSGTIYKYLGYKAQFDFADGKTALKDLYIRFLDIPWFGAITAGHFKEPFSLEELTSSRFITFMERALPNVFVPGRNVGVMANNTAFDKHMTWAVGLFRDTDNGELKSDGGYNLTARATALPWFENKGRRLAHVGVNYSFRTPNDSSTKSPRVKYEARPEAHFTEKFLGVGFHADQVHLFGAEAALVYGPFSLQTEYISSVPDVEGFTDACFNGFYVQGSYFLTGEHRPYKTSGGTFARVKPNKNFREKGGWGALEVSTRYSWLDLDDSQVEATDDAEIGRGELHNLTVGLNWYLNPNTRIVCNYIRSCPDSLTTSNAADILMVRFQVDF